MQYRIFGDNLPAVSVLLHQGESMITQSGGLAWMQDGIAMTTNMQGGAMAAFGRMFSGESIFMATYTCAAPQSEIVFSSSFPGSIAALELTPGREYICQKSAFLCSQPTVTLSATMTRSVFSGMFGGEGFVMQKLSGQGMAFLEIDGSLVEYNLAPGQVLKVDTGNVACFESTVNYEVERVRGFKNILFGGEGLFLTKLTGPGRVMLQTMTLPSFAGRIYPYLPQRSGS